MTSVTIQSQQQHIIEKELEFIKSLPNIPEGSYRGRVCNHLFLNYYEKELETIYGPRSMQKYLDRPVHIDEVYELLKVISELPKVRVVDDHSHGSNYLVDGHYSPDKRPKRLKKRANSVKHYEDKAHIIIDKDLDDNELQFHNARQMNRAKLRKAQMSGFRGAACYESVGCVAAAAELSRMINRTMSAEKFHNSRIVYLGDKCGLIEYKQYYPKYLRTTSKLHPYWYTRLELTDKGKRFIELYDSLVKMVIK